jgi:hypothetical protein
MPPQQDNALLDFVGQRFDFRAHDLIQFEMWPDL